MRFAAKAEIDALVSAQMRQHTTEHWLKVLNAARIPCGPVNNFAQALSDPQVLARDMVVDVAMPDGETLRMPGNPVKLSGAKDAAFSAPPQLGAQTQAVLGDLLGYDAGKLEALRSAGAIA